MRFRGTPADATEALPQRSGGQIRETGSGMTNAYP